MSPRMFVLLAAMLVQPALSAPAELPVDADFVQAHPAAQGSLDPVQAAAYQAFVEVPDLAEQAAHPIASRTRNGRARFMNPGADLRVAGVHLDHALHGQADLRTAHARLGAELAESPELLRAAAAEASPQVHAAMLSGLHRRNDRVWTLVIVDGLQDDAASVREVAASLLGRRADASEHLPELARAAADSDPSVRSLAVRALGVYGDASQLDVVVSRLSDSDAEVRLAAVHAVERIAPGRAASLTQALRTDPNARVQRAASAVD